MKTLGRSGWLILLAAVLPLLLFAVFQFGYSAREQRRTIESRALARSEAVMLAADAQVARLTALGDALRTSQAVKAGDLPGFRERAAELAQSSNGWLGAQLVDPATGHVLTGVGTSFDRFLRIAQPPARPSTTFVGFVGYARGGRCPCLVFETNALSNGRPTLIRLLVSQEPFTRLLPPTSEYSVSALVGPRGRFIARSVNGYQRFGNLSTTYLRSAVFSGQPNGIYRGVTLEGMENYSAFTRSKLTGWSVHLALPLGYLDAPYRTFLSSLGLAAVISVLLAGLLVYFAMRQVAEARRISERMQQAQKLEALGQLTGGIAHDFNNLLTPIVGTLDWLRRSPDLSARGKRLAEGALASAQRAGKLTTQLLAFSRRQKLQIAPVDVARTLRDMEPLLHQTIGKTHGVQLDVSDDVGCAMTDGNQLEVAVLNLALNACDASPEDCAVIIRARPLDDGGARPDVLIEVADEGAGMSEETRLRALEPFFTTKEPGKGTGLGLAQVFALAQQSGGELTIDSEVGEGTTVRLRLPGCDAPSAAAVKREQGPAALEPDASKGLRLLVVDDDPSVRAVIARTLEEAGHSVDSVGSGATALAAIREEAFDLVVTDYAMPGMDGAELIRRARGLREDSRFLIVTGYADTDAVQAVCPDAAMLLKPFTPEELLAAVDEAMKA